MSYTGWRDIVIVWLDGKEERLSVVGHVPVEVRGGVLVLRVSDNDDYRHIPLTSIREWRMRKYP